jgi:hypothetical protein
MHWKCKGWGSRGMLREIRSLSILALFEEMCDHAAFKDDVLWLFFVLVFLSDTQTELLSRLTIVFCLFETGSCCVT